MQTLTDEEKLDRESFLEAPALFTRGPRTLLVVSVFFVALCYASAVWRIDEGRHGEYTKTLKTAEAVAVSARTNIAQALARVEQRARALDLQQKNGADPLLLTQERHVISLDDITAYAVPLNRAGEPLPTGRPAPMAELLVDKAMASMRLEDFEPGVPRALELRQVPGSERLLPVVYRMASEGRIGAVVYLVRFDPLVVAARKAFEPWGGWLRIQAPDGHLVLEFHEVAGDLSFSGPSVETAESADDAMARWPLDYESLNLLVASAPRTAGDRFIVTVGLTEAAALVGYERRVDSTWLITWGVAGIVTLLVFLTAFAIRKFAVKEAYLRRLATIDALTGLPNRRSFHALLERELAKAKEAGTPLALLFLDLDNFKSVNDSVGHVVGDALLKHVGAALVQAMPAGSHVCRLAGDEFTVILPGQTAASAQKLAEGFLVDVREPAQLGGMLVRPRASIGVAAMPEHSTDGTELMRFADTAMYQAKAEGKARSLVFTEHMASHDAAAAQLMLDLEQALHRKGELYLVYQPKFSLSDKRVTGFEALIRWAHPAEGGLSPAYFIPMAEQHGLIVDLGNWVLREAVRQMMEWHESSGQWAYVSVNVSPLQLTDEGFVGMVDELLTEHGVPGKCLQLEITETALARDAELASRVLHNLRVLGVTVAVDDFGTGYSSLSSLQSFELDVLKLDRSFVSKVHTREGAEVCNAVMTLGVALGMRIVAEGVETTEQASTLAAMGCHEAQGFLLCRPLAAGLAINVKHAPKELVLELPGVGVGQRPAGPVTMSMQGSASPA